MVSLEIPPPPPEESSGLGRIFAYWFLAPLAAMAATFLLVSFDKNAAGFLIWFPLLVTLVGSIGGALTASEMLGRSSLGKIALGLITFGLLQVFYLICFVAGCTWVAGPLKI